MKKYEMTPELTASRTDTVLREIDRARRSKEAAENPQLDRLFMAIEWNIHHLQGQMRTRCEECEHKKEAERLKAASHIERLGYLLNDTRRAIPESLLEEWFQRKDIEALEWAIGFIRDRLEAHNG